MAFYPREMSRGMSDCPSGKTGEVGSLEGEGCIDSKDRWLKAFDNPFSSPEPPSTSIKESAPETARVSSRWRMNLANEGKPCSFVLHPISRSVQRRGFPNFSWPLKSHTPSTSLGTSERSRSISLASNGESDTKSNGCVSETQRSSDIDASQDISSLHNSSTIDEETIDDQIHEPISNKPSHSSDGSLVADDLHGNSNPQSVSPPSSPRQYSHDSSPSTNSTQASPTERCSTAPSSPDLTKPQLYCTFCLHPFQTTHQWQSHETTTHFKPRPESPPHDHDPTETKSKTSTRSIRSLIWRKKPKYRAQDTAAAAAASTHQHQPEPEPEESPLDPPLFWSCGICYQVLRTWDDRLDHLVEEHFCRGETMTHWDCSVSPYPWRKYSVGSLQPPDWDIHDLFALHCTLGVLPNEPPPPGCGPVMFTCKTCSLGFDDGETCIRHIELWHMPRDTWVCPTVREEEEGEDENEEDEEGQRSQLEYFYEEVIDRHGFVVDYCFACDQVLSRHGDEINNDEARRQHLREVHDLRERPCAEATADQQRFYLHLATAHNFIQDRIGVFMESSARKKRAPFSQVRWWD